MKATARAHTNIALIKYWGKRDERLFLPTNPSVSLTLDGLYTETRVAIDPTLTADAFTLNGAPGVGKEAHQVAAFLDKLRGLSGMAAFARVDSLNHVPTAAGLASSASGFAALAAAGARAYGLDLDETALSRLARQGSGSACRSIFGGFVEWRMGERPDGLDSHGVPLAGPDHWNLRMVVSVLEDKPKPIKSRDGMRETVKTSPFYPGWLATVGADVAEAKSAIARRDFTALGTVAEANALKMHATMLGATPPFTYWQPATVALMQAVWELRASGVEAYLTMDAGPNVKVLCLPEQESAVSAALQAVPGVRSLIACGPGPGISYLESAVR
jgi:diphosphomevalonate decarboxylase